MTQIIERYLILIRRLRSLLL